MCGDPPNIIIGTSLGYSFADFITNTGLIALVALVAVLVYFYFVFHSELSASNGENVDISSLPDPKEALFHRAGFRICGADCGRFGRFACRVH